MTFLSQYCYLKYNVMFDSFFNNIASLQGNIKTIIAEKLKNFIILYLKEIFINTKDLSQTQINVIRGIFQKLKRYKVFINL